MASSSNINLNRDRNMKQPVIIIRSHHIGFMFGFAVMCFAAIGVKETVTPEPQYQEAGHIVPLPEFKLAKSIDESEKFWLAREGN
jgi:hypothetical protein